jgi:hypothetical protein
MALAYDRSMLELIVKAAIGPDGPNLWGALGCMVAYAGAVVAAIDGLGDYLLQRDAHQSARAVHALRLKMGSKLIAALIVVLTAGTILVIDTNWIAFGALTIGFVLIVGWVFLAYRARDRPVVQRTATPPSAPGRSVD